MSTAVITIVVGAYINCPLSTIDLPSAEEADLQSAKDDQHERDISVPFPEVDETPAKKSSMPAPAPAQSQDKTTSTDTPNDGVIEHQVVPTTKKGSAVQFISMLNLLYAENITIVAKNHSSSNSSSNSFIS